MDTSTRDQQLQCTNRLSLMTLLLIFISIAVSVTEGAIGVNFGRIADDLPSASDVAQLVKSQGIDRIKIYDADLSILSAFSGTGVSVAVMVPNEMIQDIATNPSSAVNWISTNVAPYYPSTLINVVMVGNEILTKAEPGISPFLLNAMKNIYTALSSLNASIKVSTPHAFDVLEPSSSFPPSSGVFKSSLMPFMQPLVQFLADTGSVFMIDVYPYFAYRDDSVHITLDYALFREAASPVTDPNTGLSYSNLFDAQLDAVYSALGRLGHGDMEMVVSESGWPSAGDPDDSAATVDNAATYNQNLIAHVTQVPPVGTPLRPGVSIDTYIFELFNENQKGGSSSERHFGLFYPNMTKVGRLSPLPVFPTNYESNTAQSQEQWLWCGLSVILIHFILQFIC